MSRATYESQVFVHEPLRPFGSCLSARGPRADVRDIPVEELRALVDARRLVVLRGFELLSRSDFEAFAASWGELLRWEFGTVLDVVEHAAPKNYIFTPSSVPLHYDGAFLDRTPSLQLFQCVSAAEAAGETLFSDTVRVLACATELQAAVWRNVHLTYTMQKVVHYGGTVSAPLVGRHPRLAVETLRFAEPADDAAAKLNPLQLEVQGVTPEAVPQLLNELSAALRDPSVCYAHAWQPSDILVADNHALLHGRNAYVSGVERHLQRVHVL